MRHEPLCEWVVAYYDPSKVTAESILERLRARSCPEAKRIEPVVKEKSGIQVSLVNPLAGAGDLFQIVVKLPEGRAGKATLKLPEKWNAVDGAAPALKAGETRLDLQSAPKDPKARGKFKDQKVGIEVVVKVGEAEETFALDAQVVDWLK